MVDYIEHYAKEMEVELGRFMDRRVEVRLSGIERMNPSLYFNSPLKHDFAIELQSNRQPTPWIQTNLSLLLYLLDFRLEMTSPVVETWSQTEQVEPTPLEAKLLRSMLLPWFEPVKSFSSSEFLPEKIELVPLTAKQETNSSFILAFDVLFPGYSTTISLILPESFVSISIANDLIVQLERGRKKQMIRVTVGSFSLPLSQLHQNKEGDVLKMNIPADSLFVVEIDRSPTFAGRPGFYRGLSSLQIVKDLRNS